MRQFRLPPTGGGATSKSCEGSRALQICRHASWSAAVGASELASPRRVSPHATLMSPQYSSHGRSSQDGPSIMEPVGPAAEHTSGPKSCSREVRQSGLKGSSFSSSAQKFEQSSSVWYCSAGPVQARLTLSQYSVHAGEPPGGDAASPGPPLPASAGASWRELALWGSGGGAPVSPSSL